MAWEDFNVMPGDVSAVFQGGTEQPNTLAAEGLNNSDLTAFWDSLSPQERNPVTGEQFESAIMTEMAINDSLSPGETGDYRAIVGDASDLDKIAADANNPGVQWNPGELTGIAASFGNILKTGATLASTAIRGVRNVVSGQPYAYNNTVEETASPFGGSFMQLALIGALGYFGWKMLAKGR